MRSHRALPLAAALVLAALSLAGPPPGARAQEAEAPATGLRVALDRVLAEHAFLIIEVMRLGLEGGPEFDAAADTLDSNTEDLIGAIAGIYGDAAGDAVGVQWRNHIAFIVDYGRALDESDQDAAQLASQQLDRYVTDFSGFLADAMPALPPDAVQGLIREHVEQLQHVASFNEADYGGAYAAIRETFGHMFDIGDGLTIGIVSLFPDRFPGQYEALSPATNLRLTLDRQLGEHSYLASLAMRAVLRDAGDVQSAADALAANSADLQATIVSVYGADAGAAFAGLWGDHVAAYVAYVSAIAAEDETAADAALDELSQYRTDFSAYVAAANPFVSGVAFEALIGAHTEHLVDQADAYASGDYDASYELGREAFAHTGELSRSLAGAIADQFPQLFPDTAGPRPEAPIGLIGAGLLAVAAVLGVGRAVRTRRT
jgi:hypothetical protein